MLPVEPLEGPPGRLPRAATEPPQCRQGRLEAPWRASAVTVSDEEENALLHRREPVHPEHVKDERVDFVL